MTKTDNSMRPLQSELLWSHWPKPTNGTWVGFERDCGCWD